MKLSKGTCYKIMSCLQWVTCICFTRTHTSEVTSLWLGKPLLIYGMVEICQLSKIMHWWLSHTYMPLIKLKYCFQLRANIIKIQSTMFWMLILRAMATNSKRMHERIFFYKVVITLWQVPAFYMWRSLQCKCLFSCREQFQKENHVKRSHVPGKKR